VTTRLPAVIHHARSPQRLPAHLHEHPNVSIVKGGLEDPQALDTSFATGVDAVLSALGPTFGNPSGTPIARGYVAVLEAMRRGGVTRLIALGTVSIKDEVNNKRSVVYAAMVAAVALGARSAYKDIVAVGGVIRACEDVCLAIIRVTVLKNDENAGRIYWRCRCRGCVTCQCVCAVENAPLLLLRLHCKVTVKLPKDACARLLRTGHEFHKLPDRRNRLTTLVLQYTVYMQKPGDDISMIYDRLKTSERYDVSEHGSSRAQRHRGTVCEARCKAP
jgi:hypothetical protein